MRRTVAFAIAILLLSSSIRAADLIPDLSRIVGIERLREPESTEALLRKNGFVVVPRPYGRVFSLYRAQLLPPFVTTDSVHRTFHVILEERFKEVEAALSEEVAFITREMKEATGRIVAAGTPGPDGELPGLLAHAYFTVADCLLSGLDRPAEEFVCAEELALIRGAQGIARSPLFGYEIDYTNFKPRGFYAETPLLRRYFRAMSWYGLVAFRLVDETETRAATLIAEAFGRRKDIRERWEKIDRVYSYLLAPCDDLTPVEYADALTSARVAGVGGSELERFRAVARELRDPAINSMALPWWLMPHWKELTKGMRFLGKRHVPESEAFRHLTHPEVPKRWFPSGLDAMAANGSERARKILEGSDVARMQGYSEGARKARAVFNAAKSIERPTVFAETLKLISTLTSPPDERSPPFMRTGAYADKSLMTALAAWASTRHAYQLVAKQMVRYGGGALPAGYVEPNLPFYAQMRRLIARTTEVLRPVEGVDVERLGELDALVEKLAAIAGKELAGEPFSREDEQLLSQYASAIQWLTRPKDDQEWMVYIADVHTELFPEVRGCLEVGSGAAMPIYVVVPWGEKLHLMLGGVTSYYEFVRPISGRLTDDEWQWMVASGRAPPMPEWTSSFVACYGAEAILARLKEGEIPDGVLSVGDARIEEFLKEAVSPGGVFHGTEKLDRAVRLYAIKAGRRAVPFLLERFAREYERDKAAAHKTGDERALDVRVTATGRALQELPLEHYLPRLLKMAAEGDQERAQRIVWILAPIPDEAADQALLDLVAHSDERVKSTAAAALERRGVGRATRALLKRCRQAGPTMKAAALQGLFNVLVTQGLFRSEGWLTFEPRLTEKERQKLLEEVGSAALEAIGDPDEELSGWAMVLAARLRIEEAIPAIEKACEGRVNCFSPWALSTFRSDEGVRALLRLTRAAERQKDTLMLGVILCELADLASPLSVPRASELLDRRDPVRHKNRLVCDLAARLLARIYPDGPATKLPGDGAFVRPDAELEDWAERDDVIEAWKRFLDEPPDRRRPD